MSSADDEMDSALFAAGALTEAEHQAMLERRKADAVLARTTLEWEQALAPIAAHLAPLIPPEGLLEKIEARLDRGAGGSRSRTLRAAEGEWIEMGPGIRIKILHRHMESRRQTILLVADPGAVHPAHVH